MSSIILCFHLITPAIKKRWGNRLIFICLFDRVHINDCKCLQILVTLEVTFQLVWLDVLSALLLNTGGNFISCLSEREFVASLHGTRQEQVKKSHLSWFLLPKQPAISLQSGWVD